MNQKPKQIKQPLPQPIELAKLAALLGPASDPATAIKKALEFYVEAVLISRELPTNFERLSMAFAGEKRRAAILTQVANQARIEMFRQIPRLKLEPAQDDDQVREFLRANGITIKSARSVLDNLREYFDWHIPDFTGCSVKNGKELVDSYISEKDGKTTYMIPEYVLKGIVSSKKDRRKESRLKAWAKRKRRKTT